MYVLSRCIGVGVTQGSGAFEIRKNSHFSHVGGFSAVSMFGLGTGERL